MPAAATQLLEQATALWERGAQDNNAGRPVEAARALRAALVELDAAGVQQQRLPVLVLRCKILITLALTDFLLGGLGAARARFVEAEEVLDELGQAERPGGLGGGPRDAVRGGSRDAVRGALREDLRARLDYQRANVHGRAGDLAAAWDGLEGAVRRLGAFSPREQCSVHLSRGMLAFERSQPEQARESFAYVARIAHDEGFVEQEFMAKHNEGYAAYLLGDLPRALATMSAAAEIGADVSVAPARLDRAAVLLEAGLVSEAIEILESGLAELAGDGHDLLRAEFELRLSRAHRLAGHLERAGEAASSARAAFGALGARAWEAKAVLAGLIVELDEQLRPRRARGQLPVEPELMARLSLLGDASVAASAADTADALTATAMELGNRELATVSRIAAGEALLLAGDLPAARDRLERTRRQAPGSLADGLRGAAVLAAVRAAAGETTAARRLLAAAARRLAAGQQGSASLDLRTARSIHGVRLASLDLDLAVPRGSGAVLRTLERWRGATERLPSLGRPEDPLLAELTGRLRSTRGQMRGDPDPDRRRLLERRAAHLERQIRARDWALSSEAADAAPAPVRIREARDALERADRDLVWFFVHGHRILGVGIIGGRASMRDLMSLEEATELAHRMRIDLRTAATQRLGVLTEAVWRSLRSSAERLDERLLRPWRCSSGGLVLVTCEQLSALPWALLPSLSGRPLSIARSLTAFARAEASPVPAGPPGGGSANDRTRAVHISVGPGLARAGAEASAVEAAWRGRAVTANPSSSAGLVRALSRPGVVHVAAHGTHQMESPLFSSLTMHDGPIFAHELQPTGVAADHVVLSACDVGLATSRPGNEELGLAISMLSLGARTVVAAVAPMPDDVAADVMTRHHRGLAAGAPSDAALAAAIAESHPVAAAFLNLGGRFTPVP